MYILPIFRWSRVTLCCLFMTITLEGIADDRVWTPRFGTVTTSQTTDIKLTSQDIQLTELEQLFLNGQPVWTFRGKAEYALFNTSRIKKKPTILLPICTISERFQPGASCEFKKTDLTIKVAGQDIKWIHFAKGDTVFARFSLKFGPRTGQKIEVSHLLFERNAGSSVSSSNKDYMIFDYHLEDSGAWDGPVGATYFSAKLPFKADSLNAIAFSQGEKFKYKNRLAYFIGRKLKLDTDDGLSFYVMTPSYKHRVDAFKRKVKATPNSVKRRLAMASVLSTYPGAERIMNKHIDAALNARLREYEDSDKKNAIILYSNYMKALGNFQSTKTPCDETICIEKIKLESIIADICGSNRCKESNAKALAACCAPKDSEESRNYDHNESIEEMESDTDDEEEAAVMLPQTTKQDPDIAGFMLRYAFLLLMAALGFIGITGWIIYRVKTRNQTPRYNKTLID